MWDITQNMLKELVLAGEDSFTLTMRTYKATKQPTCLDFFRTGSSQIVMIVMVSFVHRVGIFHGIIFESR